MAARRQKDPRSAWPSVPSPGPPTPAFGWAVCAASTSMSMTRSKSSRHRPGQAASGHGYLRRCRANSGRTLLLYRAADPTAKKKAVAGPDRQKVELLGHGQQAVCYGRHPSGAELTWPDGGPLDTDLAAVASITEAQVDAFLTAVAPVLGAPPYGAKRPAKRPNDSARRRPNRRPSWPSSPRRCG